MTHEDWEAFYRAWHEEWALRRLRAAFAEARKRAKNDVEEAYFDATWAEIVEAGAQDSQLVDALLRDMGLQS